MVAPERLQPGGEVVKHDLKGRHRRTVTLKRTRTKALFHQRTRQRANIQEGFDRSDARRGGKALEPYWHKIKNFVKL